MNDYNNQQNNNLPYTGILQKLKFGMNVSDLDNAATINQWITESKSWHDLMLLWQTRSIQYYLGDQTDRGDIPNFNSNSVYNRIFEATETIVPIITGSAHQFIAIPGEENERSLAKAKKLQKVLSEKYETLEIQQKLENVVRDIIIKRYGVVEWFWNIYTNDVDVKTIDPRLVLIPKLRMDANDPNLPYILTLEEYTREEMKDFFPGVDLDKLVFGKDAEYPTPPTFLNQNRAPVYQVIRCVTNEVTMWKQGDTILKKIPNPYFDFDGEDEEVSETKENGKIVKKTFKRFRNHFDYPTKNIIFFNPFTTGDAPVAETSLCEVAIPIQDDINTQKRQIINNLVKMGNGQIYIDSDTIPKELEDQITSEPGLIIMGKNLVSENRIRREQGLPLPEAHFANLQESIVAFDNVFGTHGAVRGSSKESTLGGQILNRQQDLSRIEQLTRCINRGVARLADGLVQMMKMYYDVDHVFKILGRDGAIEFVSFNQNDVDDNTVVQVKSGTPATLDPVGRYNQAIQLWQLGALDPETLFERLEFADPQAAAQKLQAWKQGQLLFQSQLNREEAAVGVATKAAADIEVGAEEAGRDIENSNKVIQRAQQDTSGGQGRAPIKKTTNEGNKDVVM